MNNNYAQLNPAVSGIFKQNAKEQWSHFSKEDKRRLKPPFQKNFMTKQLADCQALTQPYVILMMDLFFLDYTHIEDILNVIHERLLQVWCFFWPKN